MNIYVGNLNFSTTEDDIRTAFEEYGAVSKATIITDKYSGESRGFGFVEMENDTEARAALAGLNDTDINGRTITANEARPREDRDGGGGGNRGGGGGSRGGGGGNRGGGGGGYRGGGDGRRDRY